MKKFYNIEVQPDKGDNQVFGYRVTISQDCIKQVENLFKKEGVAYSKKVAENNDEILDSEELKRMITYFDHQRSIHDKKKWWEKTAVEELFKKNYANAQFTHPVASGILTKLAPELNKVYVIGKKKEKIKFKITIEDKKLGEITLKIPYNVAAEFVNACVNTRLKVYKYDRIITELKKIRNQESTDQISQNNAKKIDYDKPYIGLE